MEAVRVALVEMPQLSEELIRTAVAGANGIDVVAAVDCAADLFDSLDAIAPDVIVWGAIGGELERRAGRFLEARAGEPIVGITGGGRDASVCTLRPHVEPLGRMSRDRLVDLLRRLGGAV